MHQSSLLKCKLFLEEYCHMERNISILEVGSKRYSSDPSFRDFIQKSWSYTGLDLEAGDNVDLVPTEPFNLKEIADDTFDVVISGQTFEHNPFFWITMADISRILKPGGLVFIIAPGGGLVHRFPVDCWRFYPDSWAALCSYTGLSILETHFETYSATKYAPGQEWKDSSLIATKPNDLSENQRRELRIHLGKILETAPKMINFDLKEKTPRPAFDAYEKLVTRHPLKNLLLKIWIFLHPNVLFRKIFLDP
jgi:SAM-dependent methyltransferase